MKKPMTLGIAGAVIALSVGLLSANGFSITPSSSVEHTTSIGPMPMLGHVTLTVTDSQGQIKEYRQGDNVVVRTGEVCTSRLVFGSAATGSLCAGAAPTATFSNIAIGTGGGSYTATSTKLSTETNAAGLGRAAATTNNVADPTGSGAVVTLSKQFTNTSGGTVTVTEAGIFNSTTFNAAGMFSAQSFTGIGLNNNDALTVTWTLNIGTG